MDRDDAVPGTSLAPGLTAALRRFASHPRLLVCLDFDGCVAELVPDAADARPVPATAEAVQELIALEGVDVAYVSGRPLQVLRELAGPPSGTMLIGSHGAETDFAGLEGDRGSSLDLTPSQRQARDRILEVMESIAAVADGAWVEHKPAGAAMHVRKVPEAHRRTEILERTRTAVDAIDGAWPKEGKEVLEAVVVQATKGEGITALRELIHPDAVFFAGDDVTDEAGFAVLAGEDLGVKVGPGETLAAHRIPDPPHLAEVLRLISAARPGGADSRGPDSTVPDSTRPGVNR